jgi:translation elongation factor P/translation initiation factor 5A
MLWFRLGTLKFRGISRGGKNIDAPNIKKKRMTYIYTVEI